MSAPNTEGLTDEEKEMILHLWTYYPQCKPVVEWALRERRKGHRYKKALEEINAIDFGDAKRLGLFFVIKIAEEALLQRESSDEEALQDEGNSPKLMKNDSFER